MSFVWDPTCVVSVLHQGDTVEKLSFGEFPCLGQSADSALGGNQTWGSGFLSQGSVQLRDCRVFPSFLRAWLPYP